MDDVQSLDLEIRAHLDRYVGRRESLEDFREWFVPATWDVHLSGNEVAERLTNRIAHFVGEYVSGDISESTLRNRLRVMRETYVLQYGSFDPVQITTALSGGVQLTSPRLVFAFAF